MARIIVFASGKGGTGKTTVVANLGTALAQLGKKTIALDADVTMANLGLILGLEGKKITLHEVLSGKKKAKQAVYEGPAGLKVVPCGMSLNGVQKVRLERLKKVVLDLAANADFLLVDSPSGMGHDSITALAVAQEAIFVITPNFASVLEAMKIKRVAERLHVKSPELIINRASGERTDLPQKEIESILELPVLGVIPEDIEVKHAIALGEAVVVRSSKAPAAKAFKKLAATLLNQKPRMA
ncbi:Septum site-determining protein MinD [subsurface metagenome]|nr:P-loop NTPase [Hadesarchaea archaeon]